MADFLDDQIDSMELAARRGAGRSGVCPAVLWKQGRCSEERPDRGIRDDLCLGGQPDGTPLGHKVDGR